MKTRESTEALARCIDACQAALRACQECAAADVDEGPDMSGCALVNLDCADMCAATINALSRRSEHHGDFCALCAHLCRACAAACEPHAPKHAHCARCLDACRACAAECQKHAAERHTN
jgi:hypothetical protein